MKEDSNIIKVNDLGRIAYKEAWEYQQSLVDELVQIKRDNRNKEEADWNHPTHHFLFCEHPPVYTLGRTGSEDHLLVDKGALERGEVEFFKINRGGDITFHGPGQVVGYPILDLDWFFTDVHKYVRYIEETIIRTLATYGITGQRMKGYTGVWISDDDQSYRKVCAIGVHLSRWVTMHGFALNVNNDLNYFNGMVPCGIAEEDKTVTSMSKELGHKIDLTTLKSEIVNQFSKLFEAKTIWKKREPSRP